MLTSKSELQEHIRRLEAVFNTKAQTFYQPDYDQTAWVICGRLAGTSSERQGGNLASHFQVCDGSVEYIYDDGQFRVTRGQIAATIMRIGSYRYHFNHGSDEYSRAHTLNTKEVVQSVYDRLCTYSGVNSRPIGILVPQSKAMFRSSSTEKGSLGYADRSGQVVVVTGELGSDQVDVDEAGRMLTIRFIDGIEATVFENELEPLS